MSKIFISHSSHENAKALALAQWLEQQGWADYFLDITPRQGFFPGERWQEALKAATDRCEAVVFLISPAWLDSKWHLTDFLQAKQLGKTIFGVIVEPTPIEKLPKEMTLCDLASGTEQQIFQVSHDSIVPHTKVSLSQAGLASLKQGLEKARLDPSIFPWPPPNDPDRLPYRGLKALEEEDAAVFFGREAPLIRALDTLRRMEVSGEQLFVILGASGAGKSSYLRAGLWPRLKRDDQHFLPLPVINPKREAITGQSGLLECLEKTFHEYGVPKTRAELRDILKKSDGLTVLLGELQTLAQKRLGPGAGPPTIVISLDQAEAYFGKEGGEEARQLLNVLGKTIGHASSQSLSAGNPSLRVIVLAAIRSDSYEWLQTAPELRGIKQTPFNLPPLSLAEYKMVIEGPAARSTAAGCELRIEGGLLKMLLHDSEGADALPLLAFILQRLLIEYGADGDLLLEEYEALGGLQKSIEAAVKDAWKDPDRHPVIPADETTRCVMLHQAFPLLVALDPEADMPKRRAAIWELLPLDAHPLLERLIEVRLLLKDRRQQADGQEVVVVEMAHEALIRHWPMLKSWVDANRDFLAWRQRVELLAGEWDRTLDPEVLLRGKMLEEAERGIASYQNAITARMKRFVQASIVRRQEAQEEQGSFLRALRMFGLGTVQRELEQRMQTVAQGQQKIAELQKQEEELQEKKAMWAERVRCAETDLNKSIPNVFISYAKEDRQDVGRLFKALKEKGFQPWMDEENILPGQDWQLSIQKAMEKSDFLLICLSKHSVTKTGFVQREMKRAVELQQDLPEGRVRLIPVRLENCDIPTSMKNWQWGDLYEPDGLNKIIQSMLFHWSKGNLSQSD